MTVTTPSDERLQRTLSLFDRRHSHQIDLSFDRLQILLDKLGRPHNRLPKIVHVAGTNGKGSTCAFLRSILESAGHRVHVYTSPHLVRFNERIRLNGTLITDEGLADCLERVHRVLGEQAITPFEAITAAAFLAFSEVEADFLILEVGLGGRFDATNIIERSEISVITPIDLDHARFLGTDISRIAEEKAGIVKRATQVVSAQQRPVCEQVIRNRALEMSAPIVVLSDEDMDRLPVQPGLTGAHQRQNAALAALTARQLSIDEHSVRKGIRATNWPARLQRLRPGPVTAMVSNTDIWLDGGHNPHAARALADFCSALPGKTSLIMSMLAEKVSPEFFSPFSSGCPDIFAIPFIAGHEGADPELLVNTARRAGLVSRSCTSLEDAMRSAARAGADQILICGSLYLAGDVLLRNNEIPD